jgi:hypothetical protein
VGFWLLCAESLRRARLGFGRLFFAIPGRRGGFERSQETGRSVSYLVNGRKKSCFIRLRRLVEAADLPHELHRGSSNLFVSYGWIEIKQDFDVSAHVATSCFL